jgi:diguanylate cyclase
MSEPLNADVSKPRCEGTEAVDPAALRRAIRAHRTISASNRTLLRATDETQLLHDMCAVAVEHGGYVRAGVAFADKGPAKKLEWMVWVGLEDGKAIDISVKELNDAGYTWDDTALGQDAMGIAIRTRKPFTRQNVVSGPVFQDPQYETLRRRAEESKYMSLTAFPLECDGAVIGALFMAASEPDAFDQQEIDLLSELAADLSYGIHTLRLRREHGKTQETIKRLTFFDQHTGLLNRAGLLQLLRSEIAAARTSRSPLALLYIEVGRFHDICNVLGYAAYDKVMLALIERLAAAAPAGSVVTTPADGEIAVVLKNSNVDAALSAARAGIAALTPPVEVSGALLDTAVAAGIAVFPGHAGDAESLARRARAAMRMGSNSPDRIAIYRAGQEQETASRLGMMSELRHAIECGEFEIYCQPKVEIKTRHPCGAEALIRWRHPVRGQIGPASFIPLAEQGGLICSITDWMLGAAFQQVYAWLEDGMARPLSVNLSAYDLHDGELVNRVRNLHSTWGIPTELIQFELTESALMKDPELAKDTLTRLKDLGFEIWIDDFGTGYSSLSYLHRFPVDAIKIDQSFVRSMAGNRDSGSIVRATIELGHNLGLNVVAEGVENETVWANLEAQGCDIAQGYFVGVPMPVNQYTSWCNRWQCMSH